MPHSTKPTSRIADTWAIVFAIVFPLLLTYVYFTLLASAPKLVQHAVYGVLKTIQFGFPLYWFLVVQRGSLDLQRPTRRGLLPGLVFGLAVLAAMWVLYKSWLFPQGWMDDAIDPILAKVKGFGIDTRPRYIALAVFYALVHSLLEEYYWRWFVFGQLRRFLSLAWAVLVSSLGFTAHHVLLLGTFFGWTSPLTWIFSVAIAIGGAIWALYYDRDKSLYPLWLSHLLVDVGIFLIGYDLRWPLTG